MNEKDRELQAAREHRLKERVYQRLVQLMDSRFQPTQVEVELVDDVDSGFRVVKCGVKCLPENFDSTLDRILAGRPIANRTDVSVPQKVVLECFISEFDDGQLQLPDSYPKLFEIELISHGNLQSDAKSDVELSIQMESQSLSDSGVHEGEDHSALTDPIDPHNEADEREITLLLSGGGFRATLFHLGVIRFLREQGKLEQVKNVFSVSGGSILAAHLALYWDDYRGTEDQFKRSADRLIRFVRSGLRETVVRIYVTFWVAMFSVLILSLSVAWYWLDYSFQSVGLFAVGAFVYFVLFRLLEPHFRPVRWLQFGYRQLYKTSDLGHIKNHDVRFHFLATNLNTGKIACFTNDGIYPSTASGTAQKDWSFITTDSCRLSECVAASSAFPPLFSPYELHRDRYKSFQGDIRKHQYLTDGGVFDNLGLRAVEQFDKSQTSVIVSDAERQFDGETEDQYRWIVGRAARATDILMNRVNQLEFKLDQLLTEMKAKRSTTFIRLQTPQVSDAGLNSISPDLYGATQRIRTDLDAFGEIEIQLLYSAGILAASQSEFGSADLGPNIAVGGHGIPAVANGDRWLPIDQLKSWTKQSALNDLKNSESPANKLWSFKSIFCWSWVVFLLAGLGFNPISQSQIRRIQIAPGTIAIDQLLDHDHRGSRYSLLTELIKKRSEEQENAQFPHGENIHFYFLETKPLTSACYGLSPSAFQFRLESSAKPAVVSVDPFLVHRNDGAIVGLEKSTTDDQQILVPKATRSARILLLIGVASDERPELSIDELQVHTSAYDE